MIAVTRAEIDAWLDTLDRAEPHHGQSVWREAYDRLHVALRHARKIRRNAAVPAIVAAAVFVILFHGDAWDWDDLRNLAVVETLVAGATHLLLAKMFAVLDREDRVQTLLRYYGAHDVPHEEEAY